jgi:DNA-binding NtrC family response regulator
MAPAPARVQALPADTQIRRLADVERAYIEHAIRVCDGNILVAARKLGISASTIYRKKEAWAAE